MFIDLKASCFARGFFLFINLIFISETFGITFVYIFVQLILLNVK